MVVPWQGALLFVGLTGLPHPDSLHRYANKVTLHLQALQTNLPTYDLNNPDDAKRAEHDAAQILLITFGIIIGFVVANIVAVCLYKSKVHDAKPPLGDGLTTMANGEFHYKLCDCFSNINECMCSFCCPTVRYADTHSSTSGSGFWGSFCQFMGMNILIGAVSTSIVQAVMPPPNIMTATADDIKNYHGDDVANIIQAILRGLAFGILARSRLRKKLGDPNPGKAAINDFFAWGWCSCCALTQESVEADIAADVTISCPFTLTKGRVRAREVAPCDHENLLGSALLVEGR